jgi:hypothetical protein
LPGRRAGGSYGSEEMCQKAESDVKQENNLYNDKYKIELLYKNLDHISNAYFSGEQIFPLWEAIYALIEGQLLVAFFTGCEEYRGLIVIVGIIFSCTWFVVVYLSSFHSKNRTDKMEDLEDILGSECDRIRLKLPGNGNFKFYKIKLSKQNKGGFLKGCLLSTWFWRKFVPILIIILWIYLRAILV